MAAEREREPNRAFHHQLQYGCNFLRWRVGRPKTPISTSLPQPFSFFLAPIELSFSQSNPQFEIGREIIPSSFSIDRSTEGEGALLLPSSALRGGGPKRALRRRRRRLSSFGGPHFLLLPPPSSTNLPRLIPFPPTDRVSKTLHGVLHWFCDAAQVRAHNLIS